MPVTGAIIAGMDGIALALLRSGFTLKQGGIGEKPAMNTATTPHSSNHWVAVW